MGRQRVRNWNNDLTDRSAGVPRCPLTRSDIRVWRTPGHDRSHACGSEPKGEGVRAWVRQASKGILFISTNSTRRPPEPYSRLHGDRHPVRSFACLADKHNSWHVSYGQTQTLPRILRTNNSCHVAYGQTQILPRVLRTNNP